MCKYYKIIEIIEQASSAIPLKRFEYNCSKVYKNKLGQEVKILKCSYVNSFKECPFFENI